MAGKPIAHAPVPWTQPPDHRWVIGFAQLFWRRVRIEMPPDPPPKSVKEPYTSESPATVKFITRRAIVAVCGGGAVTQGIFGASRCFVNALAQSDRDCVGAVACGVGGASPKRLGEDGWVRSVTKRHPASVAGRPPFGPFRPSFDGLRTNGRAWAMMTMWATRPFEDGIGACRLCTFRKLRKLACSARSVRTEPVKRPDAKGAAQL